MAFTWSGAASGSTPQAAPGGKFTWSGNAPVGIQNFQSQPPALKDVPSLNQALKTGQINQSQWMQQFKQIQAQTAPKQSSGLKTFGSALGGALNKVIINPTVGATKAVVRPAADIAVLKGGKFTHDTAQLTRDVGSPATYFLNTDIINPLKETAARATNNKTALHNSLIKANENLGLGDSGKNFKHGLLKLGAESVFLALGAKSPGIALGGAKKGVEVTKTLTGKDAAVNTLIDTQRAANATKVATVADRLGGSSVKEATTQHIPVVSPNETKAARTSLGGTAIKNADRTSIPVSGKSTQVVGKVTTKSDATYIKASNKLSDQYEKDLARIQKVPHPVTQQVLQRQLDAKYSALQEQLDNTHGKSVIDFKGKPQVIKSTDSGLPTSALDRNPPPRFNSTRIAVNEAAPKTATSASTAIKEPKTPPMAVTGGSGEQKVAGSALRTQREAVEAGMKAEQASGGAMFSGLSHKEEAAKAVDLVQTNPQKAMDIAMGRARGDNVSHESAVYHAVKNNELEKARKTGDYSTVTELANSQRHTAISEHAQALGAEGYNVNPHDPINIMNDLSKTRASALPKSKSLAKNVTAISQEVKTAAPKITRQDWHSFVESLKC